MNGLTARALATVGAIFLSPIFLANGPVLAADAWPTHPVKIVVPYAPGGSADTLGRLAAQALTEAFGQQFVVDNKGGAGGLVGSEIVAKSAPDGYNLVVSGVASHIIAPALNAANVSFDPIKDFAHIAILGGPPDVLVVHTGLTVKTLPEFIALAKSTPGGLTYGTPGIGTHGHLVAEMLQSRAGFKMTSVPYRGASQAVADLIGHQLPAGCFTLTTASEQIRAGNLRAIAVTSRKRLPDYPDVPTFVELGYPDLVATTWFALSGPAGMPEDIVNKINAAVIKGFKNPDIRKRLERDAIDPEPFTPAEFTAYVKEETKRWGPIAQSLAGKSN
jgi:tripartite-type tricarboxylate transporter receptor subunit TctC